VPVTGVEEVNALHEVLVGRDKAAQYRLAHELRRPGQLFVSQARALFAGPTCATGWMLPAPPSTGRFDCR
jgi:hypothetical protein